MDPRPGQAFAHASRNKCQQAKSSTYPGSSPTRNNLLQSLAPNPERLSLLFWPPPPFVTPREVHIYTSNRSITLPVSSIPARPNDPHSHEGLILRLRFSGTYSPQESSLSKIHKVKSQTNASQNHLAPLQKRDQTIEFILRGDLYGGSV